MKWKQMVKEKGRTQTLWKTEILYNETTVAGQPGLICYQGFWKSLKDHLEAKGHSVHVTKTAEAILPLPNLAAARIGLREWQWPWILKAMLCGDSGLIGAPTRWGKSYGMTALCNAFAGARTVITAPGVSLCRQLYEHFCEHLPARDIRGVYTGSRSKTQGPDITVCSVDSLHLMDYDDTDLLIIDEPHAVVSEERMPKLVKFRRARKYGFGATLDGRFDKKDRLIEGLIGPVISNVTYREGVACGAISPLKVIMIKVPFSKDTLPGNLPREVVYKRLLTQSSRTAGLVKRLLTEVIPDDWQTMAFIVDEKQAEFYLREAFPEHGTIAMAKRMTDKERDIVTDRIASGELVRVLASNIYVQGVTFPDLKVVLNLANGGATTTAIQKPGRLLQTRPGKNYGVMIDFMFECKDWEDETRSRPPYAGFIGECASRLKKYREIGYDVHIIDNAADAKRVLLGAYD